MFEPPWLQGERLLAVMVYPNSHNTEVRTSLSLRSTVRGANNRLDARGVLCVDKADGSTNPILSEWMWAAHRIGSTNFAPAFRLHVLPRLVSLS